MMDQLFLIVTIAGERVAIPTADVESVVELEGLTAVPRTAPHVAGLSALRSRVLTVIDGHAALEPGRSIGPALRDAIVLECDGHPYAIAVDSVEDVVEATSDVREVRTSLTGGWRRVARGMVEAEGDLLLLIDPRALIAGPEAEVALAS
jgi:purine-binding chemotaxis protein CheW